jgi:hypothetical protein
MRPRRNKEAACQGCLCGGDETIRRARRAVRWLAILALAAVAACGALARADDLVLEAAFLADPIPPAGSDLNVSLALAPGEAGWRPGYEAQPRLQLATRLAPGLGLALDGGLVRTPAGRVAAAPFAASLKLEFAEPDAGPAGFGLHASADLQADPAGWAASEAGLGLGVSRGTGPVTWRATAWGMSAVGRWDPHAHAGLSAALALGARTRLLVETVADLRRQGSALAAGPTLKVELAPGATLSAGALLGVAPWTGVVAVLVQAGRAL